MTQDEIIEMAKQSGAFMVNIGYWAFGEEDIERFAKLVAQQAQVEEREACAKICETKAETMAITGKSCDPDDLAKAIRARGNT